MKNVQHAHKVDVFYDWVDANLSNQNGFATYWPQICYDWSSEKPLHIVFEKKSQAFIWPWNSPAPLPCVHTDIDFSNGEPTLADGSHWNYNTWHQTALNGHLTNHCTTTPTSFWDWRLKVRPKNNLTCDLDLLFCKKPSGAKCDGQWVGVEATEIWYVDENEKDLQKDCYQHVSNLIHLRKQFNFKALRAQNQLMSALNGMHYLVLHRNNSNPSSLVANKVMVLELNPNTISLLEKKTSSRCDVKNNLGQFFKFCDLKSLFV